MKRLVNTRIYAGRTTVAVAACAALVTALGGCSSSSSSGGGSVSTATTTQVASGSAATQTVAAQTISRKWQQPPTAIGVTTPLRSAPPKGKTFVYLQCEIPSCTNIGNGAKAAAEAAGWTYKAVPYTESNSSSLISAFQLALNYHPTVVGVTGLSEAVWASEIPAYKQAGVAIEAAYVGPIPLNSTVIGNVGGPPDGKQHADILANWFIADSNAKGHVLSVRTDDLPSLKVFNDAFQADVTAGCTACTVSNLNIPYSDVSAGKANSSIVAALQKDPSINYIIATEGPFIDGLPAALAAAGLTDRVKIAGENSDIEGLTDVQIGTESAWSGAANTIAGWQMLDIAFRHAEGMKFNPYDGLQPKQLLTKDVKFTLTNNWNEPSDYPALFKRLWKLS